MAAEIATADPTAVAGLGPQVLEATESRRKRTGQVVHGKEGMDIGLASIQGMRDHMEDAVCVASELGIDGVSFVGTLDGHGGTFASDWSSKHLLPILLADSQLPIALQRPADHAQVFKRGFIRCDQELRDEVERMTGETSGKKGIRRAGCTACTAFITPSHVIVLNAGDSRCVVVRDSHVYQMNIEHKPLDEREATRIYDAGSYISHRGRIDDNLNVSRGLGDHSHKDNPDIPLAKQAVSPEPDIHVIERNGREQFVVVASDGLWDGLGNAQVADFLLSRWPTVGGNVQQLAEALVDEALRAGSTDNITAVVVAFTGALAKPNVTTGVGLASSAEAPPAAGAGKI